MSFCALNDHKTTRLQVIWDLGRRCTFACSYCPPHRKNNWSALASLEELVTAAHQVDRYVQLLARYNQKELYASICFSGGEPTTNPVFFDFLEYISTRLPKLEATLTTNGFYCESKCLQVIEHTGFSTVSYHTEATEKQKALVIKNLELMKKHGYGFKVNVMFHERPELFQECVELCSWLDERSMSYTPRIIGDDGDVKSGLKNKSIHTYSESQMDWYKNFWRRKKQKVGEVKEVSAKDGAATCTKEKPKEKALLGQSVGRPCCGGRSLSLLYDQDWQDATFVPTNNFQGWSCMVNWYFLYLHQEIDQIWFHQTCQVNLKGEVGPVSTISNFGQFIDDLERQMVSGKMPYIRCPKTFCGCGLCAPKAKGDELARALFKQHVPNLEPVFMELKEIKNPVTLRRAVEMYDKRIGSPDGEMVYP